jgi:hypothetical protein
MGGIVPMYGDSKYRYGVMGIPNPRSAWNVFGR